MDITSFLLGYNKGKQNSGSSKDAVVWWVTFMNGSAELCKMPVLDGDDCKDPISHGDIAKPTKESTVSTVYTYSGWALTDGSSADSSALEAVTEDRTVYAAFTESARKYTVNFYDGESLLKSMQVAYGSTPTIANPEKDGYSFDSWSPSIVTVTGNADYYAQWVEKVTFAGGTWEDIIAICEAGQAQEYFAVGDTRTETIGDVSTTLVVLGFNHDTLADGSGTASMTIWAMTPPSNTTTTPTSWETLASFMKSTIKPLLPSALRSAVKTVTKECDVKGSGIGTPVAVSFDLFPLSFDECKITRHGGRRATDSDWTQLFTPLGTAYEYFKKMYNATWSGPYQVWGESTDNYWMRQWFTDSSTLYFYTYSSFNTGSVHYADTTSSTTQAHPVMLAFCI